MPAIIDFSKLDLSNIKLENITRINGNPILGWRVKIQRKPHTILQYFPDNKYNNSSEESKNAAIAYRDAAKRSLGIF